LDTASQSTKSLYVLKILGEPWPLAPLWLRLWYVVRVKRRPRIVQRKNVLHSVGLQ